MMKISEIISPIRKHSLFIGKRKSPQHTSSTESCSTKKMILHELLATSEHSVLNLNTNEMETIKICLTENYKNNEIFNINVFNSKNKLIGVAEVLKDCNYLNIDPNSVYISSIATSSDYKGIGTEIIAQVAKLSKFLGKGGKVSLVSTTGTVRPQHKQFAKNNYNVSSAIKYKKMGFKAVDTTMDESINKAIDEKTSGLSKITYSNGALKGYVDNLSCSMVLTEDAILKYVGLDTTI